MKFLTDRKIYRLYTSTFQKRPTFLEQTDESEDKTPNIDPKDGLYEIEVNPELSVEDYGRFRTMLSKAKIILNQKAPLFGAMLSSLKTVPTYDIPTMAVDNNGNIYINPNFALNEISFNECVGVLAHEAFHHINGTFFRQKGRHMKIWNIATDYIMNRDLLENGFELPSLGCIPTFRNGSWIIEQINPHIDITRLNSEQLYTELMKVAKSSGEGEGGEEGEGKPGKGKPGKGKPGEGGKLQDDTFDDHINPGEKAPKPAGLPTKDAEGNPIGKDPSMQPNKEDTTPEQRKAIAEDKLNKILEQLKGRGGGAGGMRGVNTKWSAPKVNYKRILKDLFKTAASHYDWGRPQKRALGGGYYAPKQKQVINEINVMVALDTSGSITDQTLDLFVSEVLNILKVTKKIKMVLLLWHDTVYHSVKIDTSQQSTNNIKDLLTSLPYHAGGTTISSINTWCNQNNIKKLDALIVLTDGYVEDHPKIPNAKKKIFLIVNNGKTDILEKYGQVYEVEVE